MVWPLQLAPRWDIAAAQAVLEAAGGAVKTLDGKPLRFEGDVLNPYFVCEPAEPVGWR